VLWGVLELKNPFPSISCFRNWTPLIVLLVK
jgi:hypothetical protein